MQDSPHKVQLHRNGPSFAGSVATLYNYIITSKHLISWQIQQMFVLYCFLYS